jgi:tape measure domain-containing protein
VATRDLYLTQKQQAEITESLGDIAKISNTKIETVEGVVKKLALAAEAGTLSSRELKTTFREMPAVLDILKDKFHTNEQGLMDLASAGRISAQDIFTAVQEYLPKAQVKVADYEETSHERWQRNVRDMLEAGEAHEKFVSTVSRGGPEAIAVQDQFTESVLRSQMKTARDVR